MHSNTDVLKHFDTWYQANKDQVIADYIKLLKFPSISTDAKYKPDIEKTAEWIQKYLQERGFKAEILKTNSQPVVYAERILSKEATTLIFYGHFDVQPVDPIELWNSPPFEPTIIDNTIYARGALDNKGQMFYTVAALGAFIQAYPNAPINLKVFIEGEEESGGIGTEYALKEHKDKFRADELYVVDFDIKSNTEPSLSLGSRGIIAMELKLENARIDLHSGAHGGIALNPIRVLSQIIASFWDENGKIAINGFYEGIIPLSKEEEKAIDFSFDEKLYSKDFGVHAFSMEKGVSATKNNWIYPCIEVNGIAGGYAGEGFKTVLPAKAHAKISARLVPGQNPKEVAAKIHEHIKELMPSGMKYEFDVHHMAEAFRTKMDCAPVQKIKEALEEVFNAPCTFALSGGSVPIVPLLEKATGAKVCLFGMGLETDDIHAPNEHFGLDRFHKGFLIICSLLYKSAYGTKR